MRETEIPSENPEKQREGNGAKSPFFLILHPSSHTFSLQNESRLLCRHCASCSFIHTKKPLHLSLTVLSTQASWYNWEYVPQLGFYFTWLTSLLGLQSWVGMQANITSGLNSPKHFPITPTVWSVGLTNFLPIHSKRIIEWLCLLQLEKPCPKSDT